MDPILKLKLVRNEEIRKISSLPNDWEELQHCFYQTFGTCEFDVTYIDEEGDKITISSTDQLHDVYDEFKGRQSVKLLLKDRNSSESLRHESPDRTQTQQRLKYSDRLQTDPEFRKFVESQVSLVLDGRLSEGTRHENTTCAECSISPIVGIRYKCTVCPVYDLCAKCDTETAHEHLFIRVKIPSEETMFRGSSRHTDPPRREPEDNCHVYWAPPGHPAWGGSSYWSPPTMRNPGFWPDTYQYWGRWDQS